MDYEYDGVLQNLYCGICTQQIPNVKEAYDHNCFEDINIENLSVVGNVVTPGDRRESTFQQQNGIEYLDEYQEVCFQKFGGKEAKQNTGKDNNLRKKVQKVVDFCMKQNAERSAASCSSAEFSQAASPKDEVKTSIRRRTDASEELIDINENGIEVTENDIAYVSENNLIKLIELVRENPCLWNYTLPVQERNQYIINTSWAKIAAYFPGWTPQVARKEYSSLKSTFVRRNVMPRSGSAGINKKYWPFEPYFGFLKDVMNPRSTISNVAPPKLKKSAAKRRQDDVEDEVALQTTTLGFHKMIQDESGIPSKKKPIDPVEKILLDNITNRESRKSAASLNQWQQWGL